MRHIRNQNIQIFTLTRLKKNVSHLNILRPSKKLEVRLQYRAENNIKEFMHLG